MSRIDALSSTSSTVLVTFDTAPPVRRTPLPLGQTSILHQDRPATPSGSSGLSGLSGGSAGGEGAAGGAGGATAAGGGAGVGQDSSPGMRAAAPSFRVFSPRTKSVTRV